MNNYIKIYNKIVNLNNIVTINELKQYDDGYYIRLTNSNNNNIDIDIICNNNNDELFLKKLQNEYDELTNFLTDPGSTNKRNFFQFISLKKQ